MSNEYNKEHLHRNNSSSSTNYTSPKQAPRPRSTERDRATHAAHLIGQYNSVISEINEIDQEEEVIGLAAPEGRYIEFEGFDDSDLITKSLENKTKKIELLTVKTNEDSGKTTATVFIPDNQISFFLNRIEQYQNESTSTGKPKNKKLVDSIENIRLAVVKSLWTDSPEEFPLDDDEIWWEVWLRSSDSSISKLKTFAEAKDMKLSQRILRFQDRTVMLLHTSASKLTESIKALDFIAELRKAKVTAADFLDLTPIEEQDWVESLANLIESEGGNRPKVCILDTGINRGHPLIQEFLDESDTHSCDAGWGVDDQQGHGTKMAGICLFGDLTVPLQTTESVPVISNLESVKILPIRNNNEPDLYGELIKQAVIRVETSDPDSNRVYCMAVTSTDYRDKGQPSSWSAAIDLICSGAEDSKKRLFFISAGNVRDDFHLYPDTNVSEGVYDPGQSWNALTVGSFTEYDVIDSELHDGWRPLAEVNDLAPSSTTSSMWEDKWPIKPDILFEGGNMAISPNDETDFVDSLSLLTTARNFANRYFDVIGETSAATALASKLAAKLMHQYPEYEPETIRGLIVHSASWTDKMKEWMEADTKTERKRHMRIFGYGVVSEEKALKSANNDLTIIHEDELKPFAKNKMNVLNYHALPWPKEVLTELGNTNVQVKVTLSYYIEPNPARRGWDHKYRYQSHGLRFDIKSPLESSDDFEKRLNRALWEDGSRPSSGPSESNRWYYGSKAQNKGSIHSDIWSGTAVELAEADNIAVFPVVGWWRERYSEGFDEKIAKYSLIVSITSDDSEVDLYTEIKNIIEAEIETEIENTIF